MYLCCNYAMSIAIEILCTSIYLACDFVVSCVLGSGATAVVQVAKCLVNGQKVAIKRIDLDTCGASIEELQVLK